MAKVGDRVEKVPSDVSHEMAEDITNGVITDSITDKTGILILSYSFYRIIVVHSIFR